MLVDSKFTSLISSLQFLYFYINVHPDICLLPCCYSRIMPFRGLEMLLKGSYGDARVSLWPEDAMSRAPAAVFAHHSSTGGSLACFFLFHQSHCLLTSF